MTNQDIAVAIRSGRLNRELSRLVNGGHNVIDRIQNDFIAHVRGSRRRYDSWQEAWNDYSHHGIRLPAGRCEQCNGQGWSVKRPGPGFPVCSSCHGNRRGESVHLTARKAEVPIAQPASN